jgi:hypothetical protein
MRLEFESRWVRMRTDIPDLRFSRDGEIGVADGSILSYLRAEPGMMLVAYSPLVSWTAPTTIRGLAPGSRHSIRS